MAKRKRHARHRTTAVAVRRTKSRRRRRSMSAGGAAGMLSNPYVGMAIGVVGAGFAAYMLGKPGKDGKPLIEEPRTRALILAGGAFAARQFLKAPMPVVLGVGAVATYELAKGMLNKDKLTFGFGDGEISYVNPALLNDAATLSDAVLLADDGSEVSVYRNGAWSPYPGGY